MSCPDKPVEKTVAPYLPDSGPHGPWFDRWYCPSLSAPDSCWIIPAMSARACTRARAALAAKADSTESRCSERSCRVNGFLIGVVMAERFPPRNADGNTAANADWLEFAAVLHNSP